MATADRHLKTMSDLRDVTTTASRAACGLVVRKVVHDVTEANGVTKEGTSRRDEARK